MRLSILIPVYNEKAWVEKVVRKVLAQDVAGFSGRELVIVDDCSTDGTREVLQKLSEEFPDTIVLFSHKKNKGKSAAIKTAVEKMTGDICIIQDADLEYNPAEYSLVLEPIVEGRADCVYGSRFVGTQAKRVMFFWHYVGNRMLTLFSNMLTNLNLTDMETCYKAFRTELLKTIPIRSRRFGFEPEITAKIARRQARIYEVGISYNGRTYKEGKKITWRDGIEAVYIIIKYFVINDSVC